MDLLAAAHASVSGLLPGPPRCSRALVRSHAHAPLRRPAVLSWLSFTVTLSALAVGLLNFGDRIGRISASLFSFVAMAIMIYALVIYHWRASAIRNRTSGPYDDRLGPTMLSIMLLIAVVVNFTLRINA